MSLTLETPSAPTNRGTPTYQLTSEFLQASLPRFQSNPGLFMTWLNTWCAIYLVVGILGTRNPHLFVVHSTPVEEMPLIQEIRTEPEPPAPAKAATRSEPEESASDAPVDSLPVVVPVPVMDIRDVTFARGVVGLVTADIRKLGTFDRATPNIGVPGIVAKPGNPTAPPTAQKSTGGGTATGTGAGRRRLGPDDVDYGPPVPKPLASKYGRVEIDPNVKIWVTFGEDGAVTDVRIDPPFSHAGYEREVRAHIRKHWRSRVGANSGWSPVH